MPVVVANGGASLSNGATLRTIAAAQSPRSTIIQAHSVAPPDLPVNSYAIVNNNNTLVTHIGDGVHIIQKTTGTAGYDASAVSSVGLGGDFVLRIKITGTPTGNYGAGMDNAPTGSDSYDAIDHEWFRNTGLAEWYVFENSAGPITAAFTDATYAWIWRTGTTIGYGRGATLATAQAAPDRTVTDSATLFFDSTFFDVGERLEVKLVFPDLIGQTLVAAQGSTAPSTTIALTGLAVSVAQGQVLQGAPITGQALTVARGSVATSATIALTGQSLAAALGSVTAVTSVATTGQAVVAARGSIVASPSASLTGQAIAASRGSLIAGNSVALSGQSFAASRGTVTASASAAVLTGQVVTAARGSIAPAALLSLMGGGVVAANDSLAAAISAPLLGVGVVVARGTVVVPADEVTVALTGVAMFMAQGIVSPFDTAAMLRGRRQRRGAFSDYGIWRG